MHAHPTECQVSPASACTQRQGEPCTSKLILKDKHMEITRSDTVRVSSSANTVHRETQEDFSRNVLSGFPFFFRKYSGYTCYCKESQSTYFTTHCRSKYSRQGTLIVSHAAGWACRRCQERCWRVIPLFIFIRSRVERGVFICIELMDVIQKKSKLIFKTTDVFGEMCL